MEVMLTIPDDVAAVLRNGGSASVSRKLLEMAALEGYKSGEFTSPQVQAMLGFESRFELDGFLKAHGVFFDYTPEEIAEELATIKMLQAARS
ncbi:MAG: UPF0175 family protein [Acidobacteriota bacterium]|nr:UPF0175 family protein [Acidobacteriota bacterium]